MLCQGLWADVIATCVAYVCWTIAHVMSFAEASVYPHWKHINVTTRSANPLLPSSTGRRRFPWEWANNCMASIRSKREEQGRAHSGVSQLRLVGAVVVLVHDLPLSSLSRYVNSLLYYKARFEVSVQCQITLIHFKCDDLVWTSTTYYALHLRRAYTH